MLRPNFLYIKQKYLFRASILEKDSSTMTEELRDR